MVITFSYFRLLITTIQLNVEGVTAILRLSLAVWRHFTCYIYMAHNNKVIAIVLQVTHCTSPDVIAIAGYELCSYTASKHHDHSTSHHKTAHGQWWLDSEIEWLAIRIGDTTVVSIYTSALQLN